MKANTQYQISQRIEMFKRTLAKLKSNIGKSRYLPEIIGNVNKKIIKLKKELDSVKNLA